jgi:hypothetical protein
LRRENAETELLVRRDVEASVVSAGRDPCEEPGRVELNLVAKLA